jgi:hypothetical protein
VLLTWLPICPAATAVFLLLLFAEIAAIELLLLLMTETLKGDEFHRIADKLAVYSVAVICQPARGTTLHSS